jgi:hypothetical protein
MSNHRIARRPVKSNNVARTFAVGLIDTETGRLVRPAPYTAADLAWAAAELNRDATDYDVIEAAPKSISGGSPEAEPDWDRLAAESAALDRLEMGLCC